jgi:hypothetical protein
MVQHAPQAHPDAESVDEKQDRQLIELLNELRVALPGVQMLLAFMLIVPFSQRFVELSGRQRDLFYVSFVSTALATICFITPASFHRIIWERGMKGRLLHVSSNLVIAGTVFLGVAITCVAALLTSFLYSSGAAIAVSAGIAGAIVVLWYAAPLWLRMRHRRR